MTTVLAIEPRAQHPDETRIWPVSFLGKLAPDESLEDGSGLPDAEIDPTGPNVNVIGIIETPYTNSYGDTVAGDKAVDVQVSGVTSGTTYKLTVRSQTTRGQVLAVVCVIEGKAAS